MGAALIFVSLAAGRKAGIRYVATLLMAYYMGLILFAVWPAMGPFSICKNHVANFDTSLATFVAQETMLAKARLLLQHSTISAVQNVNMADLYIGFPCLHIAFPLIVIWSLRQWRRIAVLVAVFDLVLVSSIVILEWHYLIDLVAGIAIAALAILIQERSHAAPAAGRSAHSDVETSLRIWRQLSTERILALQNRAAESLFLLHRT